MSDQNSEELKELEVVSINELDPKKIYHVKLAKNATMEQIQGFAQAAQALGLKCLVTPAGYRFKDMKNLISQLTNAKKEELRKALFDEERRIIV